MTRETKVGLLAGMALILLIGILVSDHLSEGRKDNAAGLAQLAASAQDGLIGAHGQTPPPGPSASVPQNLEAQDRNPIPLSHEIPYTDVPAADGRVAPQERTGDLMASSVGRFPRNRIGDLTPEVDADQLEKLPDNPEGRVNLRTTRDSSWTDTFNKTPFIPARSTVEPRKQYHTVKAGENLTEIAEKYFSDGRMWTLIREQNTDKVGREGQIREGVRLVIPEKPEAEKAAEAPAIANTSRSTTTTTTTGPKTVIVKPGDTLSAIAQQQLGSSRRWEDIFEANRKELRQPEDLRVGMKLIIPAVEADAPASSNTARAAATPTSNTRATTHANAYKVRSGDTLTSIARDKMGSQDRWLDLYRANQARISDPDVLEVGLDLSIPR